MGAAYYSAAPPQVPADAGISSVPGLDGWLFATDALSLFSGQQPASAEVVSQWSARLSDDSAWLSRRGIRYLHVCVPDKLSLYGDLLGRSNATVDVERFSPMRQLVACHRVALPCLLDPLAYLSRQKHNYTLYWKSDTRWSPWACYMTYQLLCGQLQVELNNQLLGYPHSENIQLMNLDAGSLPAEPQSVRHYRLHLRSRRRHANELAMLRETGLQSTDPSLSLSRYGLGAKSVFENRHAQASALTVMLFGDANSGDSRSLLTGMLAETFAEVHFVWSPTIDRAYIDQVQPDVVITQASELQMSKVPVEPQDARETTARSLQNLADDLAINRLTVSATAATMLPSVSSLYTTRVLLARETYELAPPGVLQPHGDFNERDTCMRSNEVRLTEVQGASVYFTGPSWLVHDGADVEVLRHEVPATRHKRGRWSRYRSLSGTSLLFATSAGAHCYYHWMLEILPKLGLLEREGYRLDAIDHVLVRKITGDWQRQTLARFGIDTSRIVETDKQPHLACDRLLHIDLNCGINLKMHRFIPQWMKHLYPLETTDLPRLKLYIPRPEGVRRGVSNESEFVPLLEEAGFTVMAMEGLSVAEQAGLLARADVVMSPHGGALTNMVFSRPGITVIELFSRHVFPYYYGLAANCGHNYHAILENPSADYPRLVNSRIAQSHADCQHETAGLSFAAPVDTIRELLTAL